MNRSFRVLSSLQFAAVVATRRSTVQVPSSQLSTVSQQLRHPSKVTNRISRRNMDQTTSRSFHNGRNLFAMENAQGNSSGTIAAAPPESLGNKLIKLVGWFSGVNSRKSVLWRSAMSTYRCCVEDVNFEDFYEACGMPDTFQSWFMVNQLHIWMCLVRLKAEGKDGQFMYRKLVEIMWQDVEARMKIMGEIDSKTVRDSLKELVQEFYGLIFAYDEGLLSHDRVLAAAIWRNLYYDKRKTDASQIANLLEYIRRQVQHLDHLDSEELLTTGTIPWLPFKSGIDQEPFLYQSYHAN